MISAMMGRSSFASLSLSCGPEMCARCEKCYCGNWEQNKGDLRITGLKNCDTYLCPISITPFTCSSFSPLPLCSVPPPSEAPGSSTSDHMVSQG